MSNRALAVILFCLGGVFFLSRYAFAIWYRGSNPMRWGVEDFSMLLSAVGWMPWGLATIFFLSGLFYLLRAERDRSQP